MPLLTTTYDCDEKAVGELISVQLRPFLYSRLGSCYYYICPEILSVRHEKAAGPEAPAQHSTPPEALRAPDNPTPFLLLLPYQRSLPVLLLFKVMTDCINVPSARNFELGKENKCWLGILFC